MKPIRTPESNTVYVLPGGTEDNDLHAEQLPEGIVKSVWTATEEERALIAGGARLVLLIWGALGPARRALARASLLPGLQAADGVGRRDAALPLPGPAEAPAEQRLGLGPIGTRVLAAARAESSPRPRRATADSPFVDDLL
jgi:hypothetical protein